MELNCNVNSLINALSIVTKTINSKTTMPILEGVLLEAYENKLKLTTNNLEIATVHILNCDVYEEGKTVVDIKIFSEIIRKLESDNITIAEKDNMLIIKSINGIFKLSVMNPDEFPKLPVFEIENSISIKQSEFREMIKKTIFSISNDEKRPIYTGALFEAKKDMASLLAIDGFRLALKTVENNFDIDSFKAIIPGKVLGELLKILNNENEYIKIGTNDNQALFEVENSLIISKIINGEFFNSTKLINAVNTTKVKVETKKFLDTFERVSLFAKDNIAKDKKVFVKLKVDIDGITLSCVSQFGDAKETIPCYVEGNEIEIYFNPRYMIEALKVIEEPNIYLEFTTNAAPAYIKSVNGENYLYMILPQLKSRN